MNIDPYFYAAAIPAVFLVGLAKGGLGGSMAILGVPIMALTTSPVVAAAILLPILIVMDIIGLTAYRRTFDKPLLKLMIPAATIGVAIGYFTASLVNEAMVRLIVGLLAIAFALDYWFRPVDAVGKPSPVKGWICGAVTGFTSFISHAGGPPFQLYALPLKLDKLVFVGSSVLLFAYINAIKLIPYFLLGQFNSENLTTSAVLLPLAPISTFAGIWLVKRIPQEAFYRVMYVFIFIVGVKLSWDGVAFYLTS